MDIKELKEEYETVYRYFETAGGKELAEDFNIEILSYLLFLAGADKKFSDKEIDFIQDILGIKHKNLPETYIRISWDTFASIIPASLHRLMWEEEGTGLDFKDSKSLGFIELCYSLGNALLEVDGKTEFEETTMLKYLDFLKDYCEEKLSLQKGDTPNS